MSDDRDSFGDVLRRSRCRPLVEERGNQRGDSALPLWIVGGARLHEHPQADDRLLVVGMVIFAFGFLPFLFFTTYRKAISPSSKEK